MKLKKLMAGFLSVAMVVGTIVVPASAAGTYYPNLTGINTDTFSLSDEVNYTEVVEKSTDYDYVNFAAIGASADWTSKGFLTYDEANEVTWQVLNGSTSGVIIPEGFASPFAVSDDEYVSLATVEVSPEVKPGLAVVETRNADKGYVDFSIVVNGETATTVSNIENRFYDVTGETEKSLGETTCTTVSGNNFRGRSNYASVLDVPLALISAPRTVIENYSIVNNYGMYTLKSFTFTNGATYDTNLADTSTPGWQYRVYNSAGQIKTLSEFAGADEFGLENGDIVVWKYGTYEGTTFDNSISVN